MACQPASVLAAHLILTSRSQEAWKLVQKEDCWNSLLAAAAPHQGYEAWASSMRSRASRLAAGDHVHWAVCHLLSSGNIWQAVQLYMRHGMQREALALARCRLHIRDPAFGSLLDQLLQLLLASRLPERHERMLAQQTRQEGQHHLGRELECQRSKQQMKQLPEHKWGPGGPALSGRPHVDSPDPNSPGEVLTSLQETHITSATMPLRGVVVAETGPASAGAAGPHIASTTSGPVPVPPSTHALSKETAACALAPAADAAAGACIGLARALAGKAAREAAAANAAAASPRLVPPEALALQGLLAGRPLLAARALQAAGTTSALATAAQLCAQVVRARGTDGGRSRMRREQQELEEEDDRQQMMEDLGRACAAGAMLAMYRETQRSLAALASSGCGGCCGGRASSQSLIAVQADVQAACEKAQAASACWGGAALAGTHCALALLAWCVGRLQQLGLPESYASRDGGGDGVTASTAASTSSRSFGDAASKGSKGTVSISSDADVYATCADREAVQSSTAGEVGGTGRGGDACDEPGEGKEEYDDDDEMALLAVHATYLGRGPLASRGGAARRRVVANRQLRQTGAAAILVAAVPDAVAPKSADLAMQAQLGLGEDGHGRGAVLTAAAAAATASAMWVSACAACGVKGDDPAVACAAQAALHAATMFAADIIPVAAPPSLNARAQPGMVGQGDGLTSHGELSSRQSYSENLQISQIKECNTEDSSRDVAVPAVEDQQGGGSEDWAAGGRLQRLRSQQLESDQARSGSNDGAGAAGVDPDVGAEDRSGHPRHQDPKGKASKRNGRSGGGGGGGISGGGDIAKLAVLTTMKEAMAEMQLAICGLAAATMRAGTSQEEGASAASISSSKDNLEQAAQAVVEAARKCAALLPPPLQSPSLQLPAVAASQVHTSIAASTAPHPQFLNRHRGMHRSEPSVSPPSTSAAVLLRKTPGARGRSRELGTTATSSGGGGGGALRRVAGALEPSDPASPFHVLFLLQQQDEEVRQGLHPDQLDESHHQHNHQPHQYHLHQHIFPDRLREGLVGQQFRDQRPDGEQDVGDAAVVESASQSAEGRVIDNIDGSNDGRICSSWQRATAAAADFTRAPSNVVGGGGRMLMRYNRSKLLWVRRQVLLMESQRNIGLREEALERLRLTGLIAASFEG
ncbi:hypothetical protein VaNZ11_004681 [Volvox africanus]|uniref:Gem-associated protein 5 TPR domain-containing protein n=1 Tax=Volvox africanus TaxID=51714 RepID=A0ABQ5RXC0_9CHLO|nr:hypothetical protein VaNZ11_004681 [Volvox africanus]